MNTIIYLPLYYFYIDFIVHCINLLIGQSAAILACCLPIFLPLVIYKLSLDKTFSWATLLHISIVGGFTLFYSICLLCFSLIAIESYFLYPTVLPLNPIYQYLSLNSH